MGGGTNQSLLDRIAALEETTSTLAASLQALTENKASKTSYGLAKLSDATDVTEDLGLVLSAKEKNPAVSGSLANLVENLKNNSLAIDITEQCGFTHQKTQNSTVIKVPLAKIVFGCVYLVGEIWNQQTIIEFPVYVRRECACGIGAGSSGDGVQIIPLISGNRLRSSHSHNVVETNVCYAFLFRYE